MSNCNKCDYKLNCNIRSIKEFKNKLKDEQDDALIDREKVKVLFEKMLAEK